jgi:hypothetical protein
MQAVTFSKGRSALVLGQVKINLRPSGHEFEPKAARPGNLRAGVSGYVLKSAPAEAIADAIRAVSAGKLQLDPALSGSLAEAVSPSGAAVSLTALACSRSSPGSRSTASWRRW